ncbi:gp58-like family protein [Photobacterium damselae]|uniref:gp58-like family protein n=1 Tax=Photobacterium damselae TaxID=38293 RepID=UPI001EFC3B31|nr:gp58-like family protein [Photobacterium damselae]MCG9777579.1 gp58-like family protein [Photobacterium damselae]
MKNSLEAALDERQSAEKVLFENVTGRINGLLSEISTSFENQTSVLAQTGETASNLMNQAQKDFEVSVQMRRDEEAHLFGEMESRITGLVQNSQAIFQEQAEAIKLVGNEASSVMQSAKSELQQGLGDIDSKVKSMSETVQHELEAFRLQYQENLTRYFEQQNDLLEDSLSKQRNGLNDVVDNFRNVFESEYKARHNLLQELTAQYEKLEASAGTLERVAKAIGLNEASKMAELQDAAHTMSREIALLKKEYAKASATFTDITENLPKAMDEYFTRANESFETFFNDFDQSASTIHNKLSQAAGYLINSQVLRREFEADEVNA